MPFVTSKCQQCGKTAKVKNVFKIENARTANVLECGHILIQDVMTKRSAADIRSLDRRKLKPFQIVGVEFLEAANGRALLGDEMGLGKTVQALAFLYLHKKELLPAMFVVKSSLKVQFQHEFMRWLSEDHDEGLMFPQIIDSAKDELLPGLPGYIISYDLIRRFATETERGHTQNKLADMMEKRGVKTLILDECQQIKNTTSQRTIEVRALAAKVEHILGLSGTPIKNNAAEFFSVLNILKPERYPSYARFIKEDCTSYWTGYSMKTGAIADPDYFQRKNADFILRRTREQVMPELPLIDRRFTFCDLGSKVEKAYIEAFKQFRNDFTGSTGFEENVLAKLSKLRHLTGYAKIDPCIDFTMEFLGSTDRKLVIFLHHKDVGELLYGKLEDLMRQLELCPPLQVTSPVDPDIISAFVNGPARVLIASTLASGEGLNLQVCSDCIMLERQWNPANEEQAEGRFIRIGQTAQSVTATYFVAVGTVDEFFAEIVEKKREIVGNTLDGKAVEWNQSSIIQELAEVLAMSGGKKWGI